MQRAGPAQFVALGDIRQKAGKVVTGFAFEAALDCRRDQLNTYQGGVAARRQAAGVSRSRSRAVVFAGREAKGNNEA